MANKRIIIIGGGIGGLASAALLAKAGHSVTLLEKNKTLGGRAMVKKTKGFVFDLGPSWYLMPEIFERYFKLFDKKPSDFYTLKKLDPGYRVYFSPKNFCDIHADKQKNLSLFESFEPGAGKKIGKYIDTAKYIYEKSLKEFIYTSYTSIKDFFKPQLLMQSYSLLLVKNLDSYVKSFTSDDRIRSILEYTCVFLGGSPKKMPAIFSLMSHIDYNQGVYYPVGGIGQVIKALGSLCKTYGVTIKTEADVTQIHVNNGKAVGVQTRSESLDADIVISNADLPYTEMHLLSKKYQTFPNEYWQKKTIAPSAFIIYLGIKGKLKSLQHHTLVFSQNWDKHFKEIFDTPQWPTDLSYYICKPSQTDTSVAPPGYENIFILVPVAPGLHDTDTARKELRDQVLAHAQETLGEQFSSRIVYEQLHSQRDYVSEFNAYQGTALGLAHTLFQSSFFRPTNKSKKVENLYYVGQYTLPGIGMPMCLISAELVARRIAKEQ